MSRNATLPDPYDRVRRSAPARFAEHSMVRLCSRVVSSDGRSLPGGAVGTVVGLWAEGAAYLVEFAEPFQAVATVSAQDMVQVESTAA